MDDKDKPVVLRTVSTEAEAEMIVAVLRERGIQAQATGELTGGFRAAAPGGIRVLVRQADLERARAALGEIGPGTSRPE